MIIIVIIGVLAAIGIPAFIKYVRSSKTSEAKENLAYLYRESTTYFANDKLDDSNPFSTDLGRQFPSTTAYNPSVVPLGKKTISTGWSSIGSSWEALSFSIPDPHTFSYQYLSAGQGTAASFTARAVGDLDGDGTESTFERQGKVNSSMEVTGTKGLVEIDPME
jgi:type II secretory pathway pseudopilin PulG